MHKEKDLFRRFSLGLEPRFPAKFALAVSVRAVQGRGGRVWAGAGEFD